MSKQIEAKEASGGLFLAAGLALVAFHVVGAVFLDRFALDLGTLNFPSPRYLTFVECWTIFGGLSAVLLALAVSRRLASSEHLDRLAAEWHAVSDRSFLMCACGAAFAIPLFLRLVVLKGAPLTDDESAYRFAAQLLASGRLWVASPPLKLFFDQNFMINDGRLYPVYFLGWPALLALGVWLHAPGIMNPLASALTVPALFRVLRYFAGPEWARAGVLLFLSAPFLQIAAATGLSHTSCIMALTWCLFMYTQTRESHASWRYHAGFAVSFALAFWIRPQSAAALGLPLVVSWGLGVWRLPRGQRLQPAVAFLLPAAILASLFLGVLWAQNGSPLRVGYARSYQYMAENGFRFATWRPADRTAVPGFDFLHVGQAIARTVVGLFRLNFDLFGWPSSFALLVLVLPVRSKRSRILWWMVGSFLLLMLFQTDWGIDTFGPVHAIELALPVLVLTMIGARNLGERLTLAQRKDVTLRPGHMSVVPASLLVALIVTAWLGFVPVRLNAVRQIAIHLNIALRAPERANIHRAVIFAPWPLAPPCNGVPTHFVHFRPTNDPDLQNDILWVNHLTIEDDRRLMESLPARTGYVLRWTSQCEVEMLPLASLDPSAVPASVWAPPGGVQ